MRTTYKAQFAAAAVTSILLCRMPAAMAQEACQNDYEATRANVASEFGPELTTTAIEIKKLQDAGLNPNGYVVMWEGKYVPITVKFHTLADRAGAKNRDAHDTASKCAKDVMPFRIAADLAIIYATSGLSLVLPPEMTRIDFAEVIKNGKPFGGDSALVPKARDDVLRGLGIGGDVAKILRDPKCILGICH